MDSISKLQIFSLVVIFSGGGVGGCHTQWHVIISTTVLTSRSFDISQDASSPLCQCFFNIRDSEPILFQIWISFTRCCCDVKSTSMTLIQRRNKIVCPTGNSGRRPSIITGIDVYFWLMIMMITCYLLDKLAQYLLSGPSYPQSHIIVGGFFVALILLW